MIDPTTGAMDSSGPFSYTEASAEVDRRQRELHEEGLDDVKVLLVRHHLRTVDSDAGE